MQLNGARVSRERTWENVLFGSILDLCSGSSFESDLLFVLFLPILIVFCDSVGSIVGFIRGKDKALKLVSHDKTSLLSLWLSSLFFLCTCDLV